jgi:glutaredoxin
MPAFTVYWQPGCSSCLRAKEFLTAHGIEFASVNVRTDPEAMTALARHGLKTVPVVMRGEAYVHGQDLDELARFVGVDPARPKLPEEVLAARIGIVLAAAARLVRQIPETRLRAPLPGRDRSALDLAFHVGMIPTAFLEAVRGGSIAFEHFERRAPADADAGTVAAFLCAVADEVARWWSNGAHPATVGTYYGVQPFDGALERTAWHAAQHTRQLEAIVRAAGRVPEEPLTPADLAGLPLPAEVYDDEVKLAE